MSNTQPATLPDNALKIVNSASKDHPEGDSFTVLRQWMVPVEGNSWATIHPEIMPYLGAQ